MRLTPVEQQRIRETVHAIVGADSRVSLFGSRTDDHALGGDIDLLVEVDHPVQTPVVVGARIAATLQRELGDRRIDVLMLAPNVAERPIHRVARASGIEL